MRLSIIVPAYKVENYIEKCLRSLEDQELDKSEYEIIVTNDGSPDQSREIVEKLQLEFANIVLLNQENQGVSMARNNAIAHANGKYIMPIDPDDYILPNTLKEKLLKAEAQDLDVLYLGFEIFDADEHSLWHTDYSVQQQHIYEGVNGYFVSRGNAVRDPDRSWAILYRRSMLEKYELQYPKDVPFLEDGLFLAKVFSVARRVGFDNHKFHQRTTSIGSATVSGVYYSKKAINGFLNAALDIKAFGKKHTFTKEQSGLIHHGTANFVLLALFPLVSFKYLKQLYLTINKIKALGFDKLETDGVVEPYLKYAKFFNISPYYFLLRYSKEMAVKKFC
ncbi:MAG: glycosyltransferase [Burkholderiales bacterium]|nr:glycosyltransferase [Flavobacterium sp.]